MTIHSNIGWARPTDGSSSTSSGVPTGGISITSKHDLILSIYDSSFWGNSGQSSGALSVYMEKNLTMDMRGCSFYSNMAVASSAVLKMSPELTTDGAITGHATIVTLLASGVVSVSDTSFVDNGVSPENLEPVSSAGESGSMTIACMGSANTTNVCNLSMEAGSFINNSGASTALLLLSGTGMHPLCI